MHVISGKLTDFSDNPLNGGQIILKGDDFEDLLTVVTDDEGRFTLSAKSNTYNALYAVKDYKTKFLEFWFWDLPLNRDLDLHIKIDGLEIYGIKAWRTWRGALVYFRPMSLKRYGALGRPDKTKLALISPQLRIEDINVSLDGRSTQVWAINKVQEKADSSENYMDAYLIHIDDQRSTKGKDWQMLRIELFDRETGEHGQGCAPLK
jgi:hypothetical protein